MDRTTSGWVSGTIGMLLFSGSLPATRAAVGGFDPIFLTGSRAAIAGGLALALLLALRQKLPPRRQLASLALVAASGVIVFPLLTALALQRTTSAHSLVFIGLLPLCTAIFGVLRGGERPHAAFWLFAGFGATIVAGYSLAYGHGTSLVSDGLMVVGVIVCGLGYAEGGRLSRTIGGWQVISWALVAALPIMVSLAVVTRPSAWGGIPASAWVGLFYVSVFSMLIGFMFWYRGLALGGIAAVGQLQLLQPFFGLIISATLLHETVDPSVIVVVAAVVLCVAGAKRFAKAPTEGIALDLGREPERAT